MMLENHFHLSYAQYVSIMLLCLLGIVLNTAMLVIFVTKKQVRGSVYTTYMIQIAVTDLLVCIIWLVMSPIFISEIQGHLIALGQEESSTTVMDLHELGALKEDVTGASNFVFYRVTFSVYYLHYYFNIFLLATMSVERCVAVWKSLRCQRYQFNRKFIIIVSVVMGVAAIACALPSLWDQELITSDFKSNSSSDANEQSEPNFELYQRCFQPLGYALKHNHTFVMDRGDVSVTKCVETLTNLSIGHLDNSGGLSFYDEGVDLFANDGGDASAEDESALPEDLDVDDLFGYGEYEDSYGSEEYEEVNITERVEWPPGSGSYIEAADRMLYHQLLNFALSAFPVEYDMKAMCDPALSGEARVYQIIVHLVIGFFIPFTAIVVSYASIAYMIGKRARERLEPEATVELHVGRRMSDFLKQFVSGGSSFKTDGDRTPPYNCGSSPLLRRSMRQKRRKMEESAHLAATDANSEAKSTPEERPSPSRAQTHTNGLQSTSAAPTAAAEDRSLIESSSPTKARGVNRPRLRSATVNLRRTSGGSASSAESFQTDQTSIHTSTSPGVRLSAPTFANQDKVLVKRACSAESSASTATTTTTQGNPHQRWSNDVFRSNSVDEELKRQHGGPHNHNEEFESPYEAAEHDSTSLKRSSGTPSRVHKQSVSDSTQDLWQGSHTRLYTQKSESAKRPFNRQISTTSNYYRGRAYSAQSRGSTGTGTMRKTIVHKHAERHMRVSRTVLTYIVVFAICWLPQRIVHTLYITESWVGRSGYFCHAMTATTRVLTFFSVLLNPIVYAITQREILAYLRQKARALCLCGRASKRSKAGGRQNGADHNGFAGNENQDFSRQAEHNVTSEEVSRRERHLRNRELWSRMVNRLGRKSMVTASGASMHGEKKSDGTIDEEREEEKGQSSKGQSSSASLKLISSWEDWQQLIDDMSGNKNDASPPINETIL